MSNEEYRHIQNELFKLALNVSCLDLREFLNRIEHTDAVAPIADPTFYHAGLKPLRLIKELAEAALTFHNRTKDIISRPEVRAAFLTALNAEQVVDEGNAM